MHVVLPEVDGKIFAGIVSTKEATKKDQNLQYSRFIHSPLEERVSQISVKIDKWIKLQTKHKKKKFPKSHLCCLLTLVKNGKWLMQ